MLDLRPYVLIGAAVLGSVGCGPSEAPAPAGSPLAAPPTTAAPGGGTEAASSGAGPVAVDPAIPAYQPTSGISGNLSSVGSDTMNNLMTLWGESCSRTYPNVKLQVEGKGSSTAPPALISGTAQFGPMSRQMKGTEVAEFEKKFGYRPTEVRAALDALAVFVHRDNPLASVTLPQADAVFSKSRRQGHPNDITAWGDLGRTGDWASRPLSLYGRNSASGTYGFFKEHVLKNGDFKDQVKEQPGSASVVQGVSNDRFAIGYSGIGYKTSGVRAVPLAEKEGATPSAGSYEDVVSGKYPLSRYLYIYVNKAPGKPVDPLVREFLKLVVSRQGQEVVIKDGYLPLPAKVAEEELKKLE